MLSIRRLEQMPHFDPLRLEIFGVVRIWFAPDRDLFDHLDSVTFQADDFFRIVGEETEFSHSQVVKNLRANAVIAQIAGETELGVGFHRVETFLLQFVGVNLRRQSDPTPFLPHVDKDAAGFAKLAEQAKSALAAAKAA